MINFGLTSKTITLGPRGAVRLGAVAVLGRHFG